jgi:enoyl-CoA hydratase
MELVTYARDDRIATITMDDGRVNALSPRMLGELNEAFDQAVADAAIVVLTGREKRFSGGFDLNLLRAGGEPAKAMVRAGFALAARVLSFPTPVVIACNGHAVAMAAFLLASADYRIGVEGDFKIMANEVAIGITVPEAAIVLCRARLTPAAFQRSMLLSEVHSPDSAVAAGFLDRVVPEADLARTASETARALTALDIASHTATKLRVRRYTLEALKAAIA